FEGLLLIAGKKRGRDDGEGVAFLVDRGNEACLAALGVELCQQRRSERRAMREIDEPSRARGGKRGRRDGKGPPEGEALPNAATLGGLSRGSRQPRLDAFPDCVGAHNR